MPLLILTLIALLAEGCLICPECKPGIQAQSQAQSQSQGAGQGTKSTQSTTTETVKDAGTTEKK